MSYDTRCYDLAELFLSDTQINTEARRKELAQLIQTTIEDFLDYEQAEQTRRELDDHTISAHGAKYT